MKRKRKTFPSCPNCGYNFQSMSNFCPQCGQENHDLNIPIKHLFGELFESILHLDTKTFRTLKALLFKPGFLTNQFNSGKRKSFVPPIRLYIFISFTFFLLINIPSFKHESTIDKKAVNFNLSFQTITSEQLKGLTENQIDSLLLVNDIEPSRLNKYIARQLAHMATRSNHETILYLTKSISYMIFFLMPVFGVMLFLIYRKSANYYIECLVHSIYLHSFILLLLTIYVIISWLYSSPILFGVIWLFAIVYFYFSLKGVYKQSNGSTMVKTILLGLSYLIIMTVLFILTVFISILIF